MSGISFNLPNAATFATASAKSHVTPITLDPKSFAVLAATVRAGLNLPQSVEEFHQRYNRQAFEETLARDMSVYDRLAENFASVYGLSNDFRKTGVPAMISTGQILTETGAQATKFMNEVKRLMESGFDSSARDNVLARLGGLTQRAERLASEARVLFDFLSAYKVQSETRFQELDGTTNRWHEIALSDEARQRKVQEKVRQLDELIRQARQESAQAERQKIVADTYAKYKWMLIGQPFGGAALMGVSDKLFGSMEDYRARAAKLEENYNKMIATAGADQQQLIAAEMAMQLLRNTMIDMKTQSSDIAASVKQIHTAASRMVTENEQLARKIESLDGDMDAVEEELEENNAEAIKDLITDSMDDVDMCISMWQQVQRVGEEFERGGRLVMG